MTNAIRRRDFVKGAAAVPLMAGLATAASEESRPPVRLGFIGVGSRGTYHVRLALNAGVEIPAICDVKEAHTNRAVDIVAEARDGRKPQGYSRGPTDYRRMLQRDDLDAVIIATPMQDHAVMSIDALGAGKHVLCEVSAAMTVDECWGLVHAAAETGKIYMLAENCCYWAPSMMILNMVQNGVFGPLTFAECGYVHDCRFLSFDADGQITWRGELGRDHRGNLYPTHSLGPVAQWMGINRGDRLTSLLAMDTRQVAMSSYLAERFPEDHPARQVRFTVGDSTTVLIRTASGALIDLRYDTKSSRPHPSTTYYSLQGDTAAYDSRSGIWTKARSKGGRKWGPLEEYTAEYEHPMWTEWRSKAEGTGHNGGDFFVQHEFLQAIHTGGPSPIDAMDAAAWSSILPLSGKSLAEGGQPVEIPDFTEGKWET